MSLELTAEVGADARLAEVRAAYERGKYLTAHRLAEAIAPLREWSGTARRILAGRLAGNIGSSRLADWHVVRAYRADPGDADAIWYFANYLANVRGPWRAWRFLKNREMPAGASDEARSHWFSLKGRILGMMRDFDAADEWLSRAESLGTHVWTSMERAAVLMFEDRHDDAEAVVRTALDVRPWYRPAVQWLAHFLVQRERDDDALALLREACAQLESNAIWMQRHNLERELELFDDAARSLDEFERHSPLLDPIAGEWLAGRRADIAYWRGDWATAKEQADKAVSLAKKRESPFYKAFAAALDAPRPEKAKCELAVPFVRQNFQTCVPATLAALCRFWGHEVDHEAAAEAITYRGTSHGKERRWANENGYVTKEFTVTWDATVALIDRGIAFTLTTAEVSSSHLQAIIGYDVVRKSFLIRDPGERHRREFFAEAFFERYLATGPRGMALAPAAEAERLRSLALPDESLHDRLNRIETALEAHRRDDAAAEVAALEAENPGHLVSLQARRTIEAYDANTPGVLAAVDKMLAMHPNDLRLQLAKVGCLREMGRREDRLAMLKAMAEAPKTDPACWQHYAQELADDAREHVRARMFLEKAIRFLPSLATNYATLSRIFWDQRRFDEAFETDRFAVCLEDKDEYLARNYFQTARTMRKTDEALEVLRRRFERFGSKAMLPARTLYFALVELERVDEAMATLHRALELRPTDGDLLAFVGESYLARGKFEEARGYLERAKGLCQPGMWLRISANFARQENDLPRCRQLWEQVLQSEPLAMDAHRSYAQTLAEIDGREAAVAHLRATCERFPHHFQLAQLLLEWLREDDAATREPVIRRLIAIHPADGWARREYALLLADQRRFDEAREQLALAAQLDPKNPSLWATRFQVHSTLGELAEAKEDARQAVRLSIDYEIAQQDLLSTCDTLAERRDALAFIEEELIRQVTFGQGLLFFRDIAQGTLEQDELLASLRKGLDARPDLWHAWAAVVRQLTFMNRLDEAEQVANEAVNRFPHLPALWVDLSSLYHSRGDRDGEVAALQQALAISPSWSVAQHALASAYESAGRLEEAQAVYEAALQRNPLMAANHIALAEFHARRDSKEKALDLAAEAVRIEPGLVIAWNRYIEWSQALKRLDEAIAYARRGTVERPGEARSWLRLAQALASRPIDPDPEVDRKNVDELLAVYDETLKRNPRLFDIHDRKASLLSEVGRYPEALAACRPEAYGGKAPVPLQGRAAWILAKQGDLPSAVKTMREVLAIDRNYQWGWTMIADWLLSLGRWDEYLDAAENLVRISPADPVGFGYRGEAKLRLGRREEGLADLRRSRDLAPSYPFPSLTLFEEHFAAGELDQAAEALAHLKKHAPGDETTARELRLALRRGETTAALQILRKLGRADGENPGPLQLAIQTLEQGGLGDQVIRVLSELAADGRSHPYAAVLLCERTDPKNEELLDERLKYLDRAIERIGSKSRPLDLKAELLALAGRFEEALAVCSGPQSPDAELPLKGRAAWIRHLRGHHAKAVRAMQDVLAEHPNYFWGWTQIAQWAEQLNDGDLHRRAGERLIEIAPADAVGYIELGRMHMAAGRVAQTRELYDRAVQLNPQNVPLGLELIGLHVRAWDAAAAKRTLDAIEPFMDPAEASKKRRLVEHVSSSPIERIVRVLTFRGPSWAEVSQLNDPAALVLIAFAVGIVGIVGGLAGWIGRRS